MPSRVKNQKIYAPGVLLSTFHSPAPLFWFLFLVDHQYNDQADVEEQTLRVLAKYSFYYRVSKKTLISVQRLLEALKSELLMKVGLVLNKIRKIY